MKKVSKLFFAVSCMALLAACSSTQEESKNTYRQGGDRPLVDDKYSLRADRAEIENLRAQVPEQTKKQNDELAFILSLMSDPKRQPSEIRSQFDQLLRKKRDLFDRDVKAERENFTKEERKKREEFLKGQQKQREEFNRGKRSREERAEFYKGLDEKRSEFFSVEKERRADFESDVRERRKNFEDYARQKQNEFNQEYRAHSKRHEDWKKEQSRQRPGSVPSSSNMNPSNSLAAQAFLSDAEELERELQELQSRPGTRLESGE